MVKWSDLNPEQRILLAANYLLAISVPPSLAKDLRLPVEASTAIAELCVTTGHYHVRKFLRQGFSPMVTSNRKRIVRARKAKGSLA